jgi:hypothetical protein
LGSSAYLAAVASAADVLDIGLAFPRANATYAPADDFPIVFALQNSKLSEHLNPSIWFRVINITNWPPDIEVLVSESTFEFNWTRASANDPYFLWSSFNVEGEGKLRIMWQPSWSSCDESCSQPDIARNHTENFLVDFEIKQGGGNADLVAATNGDSNDCPNEGIAIEVFDKTLVSPAGYLGRKETETCAVLPPSSTAAASNPCKVKIDEAVVESMKTGDLIKECRAINKPAECPEEDLALPKIAAVGISGLAAILGAAFLLG